MDPVVKKMIENLEKTTGKPLQHWIDRVHDSSITKHGELVKMLKTQHGLGHGYANLVVHTAQKSAASTGLADDGALIDAQYEGKEQLRPIFEALLSGIKKLGSDVTIAPKKSSVSCRRKRQFALIQPTTKTRIHLLHLDFPLHVELGKNKDQGLSKKELLNRYSKSRNVGSAGHVRAKETLDNKIASSIKMLRRALAVGFQASYILADSWFFCSKLVKFTVGKDLDLISRPKFNNWKYQYNDREFTLGALAKKFRYHKKKKWNKLLRLHHISVSVIFKGTPITLFFYKEKKRGTPWQAIASTDRKLGAIQAYKIYQNRWSIEVSYKELKQLLGFGKCQSRDFDGQISDLTCCLMAFNHLSNIKALTKYQSIGSIFDQISKSWISPNLMQRFWDHIYLIIQQIAILVDKNFDELLNIAMNKNGFFGDWNKIQLNLRAETCVNNKPLRLSDFLENST